jgi:pimeloyl-ACP methyl ester carboxylesterase
MSTFVLVHGAWHGSWCWKKLRRVLRAKGHDVFSPTLTGLGERAHLLSPTVDLDTHINDVANLIKWEDLSDVILCGHSYGGCVISGVADRMPERIAALVYLDAFVPNDGECVLDVLPPEVKAAQMNLAQQTGEGWKLPPIPAEAFNVNPTDRSWVNAQCTMQPLAAFQQPIRLTGQSDPVRSVTYVAATGWGPSPFGPHCERARAKGWKIVDISCGHDVMLDEAEELARVLIDAGVGSSVAAV